jgi:peptidoglycan glycosyltransferase
MARVAAVIAAGGRMAPVHWVAAGESETGAPEQPIEARTAAQIGSYMRRAVERGTAQRLAGRRPPAAGKTGTAQIASGAPHAWFVGFAPSGAAARRVAVAVLLENGGAGGGRATELAGQVMAEAATLGLARAAPEEKP